METLESKSTHFSSFFMKFGFKHQYIQQFKKKNRTTMDGFLVESPPKPTLSPGQISFCFDALKSAREKLQTPKRIHQEFQSLQENQMKTDDMMRSCTVALEATNLNKNRYADVLPFDANRIVLNSSKPSGYVNASLMKVGSTKSVSEVIATQRPLPHTYEDFWEMIIQYHCPVIVMLTELADNYTMTTGQDYFQAEDGPREFGKIHVATKWTRASDSSFILRYLEVTSKESKEPPHFVLHIQYPEWPDNGVPLDTLAVREILKRIYHVPPSLGPIVVHCSAGVGRTGTFCTILDTIQRILDEHTSALNIVDTVALLRRQRMGVVETMDQYTFCYKAILDELEDFTSDFSH